MVNLNNNCDFTRYCNGFIFSPSTENGVMLEDWDKHEIQEFTLQHDNSYSCQLAEDSSSFLILIGRAIYVYDNNNDVCSQNLLTILNTSEVSFFEELDKINGRFAIIYRAHNKPVKVINDACGMRSVFYTKLKSNYYASHPSLLSHAINSSKNKYGYLLSKYSSYHLPGNITTYDDVYQLIPNHYLNSSSNSLVRFFPRDDLQPSKDIDLSRKMLSQHLMHQVRQLINKNKLLCSISAGIDSRVTLAATRLHSNEIDYFTYYGGKGESSDILSVDKNVVSDIALNLNLNHTLFKVDQEHSDIARKLQAKILQESHITHQASIALELMNRFGHKNYLHLRSNLLEIGRVFYRDHYNIKSEQFSLNDAIVCYSEKAKNDDEVRTLFEHFFNEVSYENLPSGYDPFDLFYWEYRMGIWHSLILLESDLAFDTHILFNSRYFLKELLSIPYDVRKDNRFYLSMCEDNWPILGYWGVNNTYHAASVFDKDIHITKNAILFDNINFISGSIKEGNIPRFNSVKKQFSAMFNLIDSGPLKGDYVSLIAPIEVVNDKKLVVNLRTPFANPKLLGRMAVVIELDNEEVWIKDASSWKETQQIVIDLTPGLHTLKVKSLALKDCEKWSWGKAGSIVIERLSII